MKRFLLSLGLAVLAMGAQAETKLSQAHVNSMACLENMGAKHQLGPMSGLDL